MDEEHPARTPIKALLHSAMIGRRARLEGWVRTRRDSKGFSFLEINDGSCLDNIQVVVGEALPDYGIVSRIATGSSVTVTGKVVTSPGKG